ncbi:MAG: ATP-binding protein [Erysipelotrichaceae bacterium]|nr:ATP-binding protein [Erysipelotrichaceae bacterium]
MRNKIFKNLLYLAILCSVLTFVAMSVFMYSLFYDQMKNEIRTETLYIATALNIDEDSYLSKLNDVTSINRITIIDTDGAVLFDTDYDKDKMENHLYRPEVKNALETGKGEATRYSTTINQQTFYYAMQLDNGHILRVASITSSVITALISGIPFLVILLAFLMFVTLYVSHRQANNLLAPINSLNLDNPLANETYDDLSPLLLRIDEQNRTNLEQMRLLDEQHHEFDSIIDNMQEGLVVVGKNANILTINKSACSIFNIKKEDAINKSYLVLDRSDEFIKTIDNALKDQVSELNYFANSRIYQMIINPILNDTSNALIIILIDITEKYERENLRREFTANVSHELKTPLTSIIGYAEIIENGIAKKEDVPKFVNQINTEAQSLLNMIDDIIMLSYLDEDDKEITKEVISLKPLCIEVIQSLQLKAQKNNISLSLIGDDLKVLGVRNILYEMIYNLCDNAIKYNKPQGEVTISIFNKDGKVVVEVKDTGIGIAKDHYQRIFERFYRVDKSHSRSTGGTGLGLAIVKNGARFHKATVGIESIEDKGTTFTIKFPR